nr:fimbrillin family protein [Elizabethkingia sp. ASV34]
MKIIYFLILFFLIFSCRVSDSIAYQEARPIDLGGGLAISAKTVIADINNVSAYSPYSYKKNSIIECENKIYPIDSKLYLDVSVTSEDLINTSYKGSIKNILIGARYFIAVYDDKGNYIEQKEFIVGSSNEENSFTLKKGKKYTFIAASINSKTDIPVIQEHLSLENAKVTATLGQYLLFFKKEVQTTSENISINISFKHLLNQIKVKFDASEFNSSIRSISGLYVEPVRSFATIHFKNEEVIYDKNINDRGAEILFPLLNQQIVESRATNIIFSPQDQFARFNLQIIRIGNLIRKKIKINDIKISPGKMYRINIKLRKFDPVCTKLEYGFNISRNPFRLTKIPVRDANGNMTFANVYAKVEQGSILPVKDPYSAFGEEASNGSVKMQRNYYRIGDLGMTTGAYSKVTLIFDRPINFVGVKATWFKGVVGDFVDSMKISTNNTNNFLSIISDIWVPGKENYNVETGRNYIYTEIKPFNLFNTSGLAYIIKSDEYFTELTVSFDKNKDDILQAFTFCNAIVK